MDQELTDHRPWGHYTILADEPNHKVKRIVVSPGKRFSLQKQAQEQSEAQNGGPAAQFERENATATRKNFKCMCESLSNIHSSEPRAPVEVG